MPLRKTTAVLLALAVLSAGCGGTKTVTVAPAAASRCANAVRLQHRYALAAIKLGIDIAEVYHAPSRYAQQQRDAYGRLRTDWGNCR